VSSIGAFSSTSGNRVKKSSNLIMIKSRMREADMQPTVAGARFPKFVIHRGPLARPSEGRGHWKPY
jgi:hypothetical protein